MLFCFRFDGFFLYILVIFGNFSRILIASIFSVFFSRSCVISKFGCFPLVFCDIMDHEPESFGWFKFHIRFAWIFANTYTLYLNMYDMYAGWSVFACINVLSVVYSKNNRNVKKTVTHATLHLNKQCDDVVWYENFFFFLTQKKSVDDWWNGRCFKGTIEPNKMPTSEK